MSIKEYEILPLNNGNQSGGSHDYITNKRIRMLKIFVALLKSKAINDDFKLLKSDGNINESANIAELLELTQSRQERSQGLDDFIHQLIKANVDPNLIMNSNLKAKVESKDDIEQMSDEININNSENSNLVNDNNNNLPHEDEIDRTEQSPTNNSPRENGTEFNLSDELNSFRNLENKSQEKERLSSSGDNDGTISPIIGDERFQNTNKRKLVANFSPRKKLKSNIKVNNKNISKIRTKRNKKFRSKSYSTRGNNRKYRLDSDTDTYEWEVI